MIAMDLARELKVVGLPWRPRRGDLAMDRLNDLFVVLRDGPDDAGGVEIDTGHGWEHKHYLMLTWIPRLDQLLAFLARYGSCDLSVRPAGAERKDVRWELVIRSRSGGAEDEPRRFQATDAADAAGQALHYLLAAAGWRPGPALAGL
ncbi:MAG: hypothetical protein ACRDI2_18720 [Chloroflexota bacterium]